MNVQEKMKKLNIQPVNEKVYLQHLRQWELLGQDMSEQKYYKMYGDTPMFYSDDYLNKHSIDALLKDNKRSREMLNPTLIAKLLSKCDAWWFRFRYMKQ
ncbi:hypothetical protein [Paenibacillus antarcticus]|uniref:Uncharacterized protein n=1 Tax=Paenibacillus antarcticus TaxID=253703 RepID=A0A162MGN1_9BACL|nr:hypothetical protein [Paenibacillus antarcticus]OAB48475.1 hypothetical protein PBAT_02250 [Paenibacillus antarcticus]